MPTDSQMNLEGCGTCRRSTQNAWGGKRRLFKNDPRLILLNGWPFCFFLGFSEDVLEQMFAQLPLSEVESHFYSAWGMSLTHHPQPLVKCSHLVSNGFQWFMDWPGLLRCFATPNYFVDKIWDFYKATWKILVGKNDKCASDIWIPTFLFPYLFLAIYWSKKTDTSFHL